MLYTAISRTRTAESFRLLHDDRDHLRELEHPRELVLREAGVGQEQGAVFSHKTHGKGARAGAPTPARRATSGR